MLQTRRLRPFPDVEPALTKSGFFWPHLARLMQSFDSKGLAP